MTRHTSKDAMLDIGNGLRIGLKDSAAWFVQAKNGSFDLGETVEFTRVLVLLERPYSEAQLLLKELSDRQNAEHQFPLWKVVCAGLDIQSDQWASLALTWVPSLPVSEQALLEGSLMSLRTSKWASQKSRQLADLYLKQIRAAGM